MYGANISVIHNTKFLESTPKNKKNNLCYYSISDVVAMVELRISHVWKYDNVSDFFTKVNFVANSRKMVGDILYDIYYYYY